MINVHIFVEIYVCTRNIQYNDTVMIHVLFCTNYMADSYFVILAIIAMAHYEMILL